MKAIILAGGKGTRLGSITKKIPKPLVPISGKPVLEHLINFLVSNGITDIRILVGYKAEMIQSYFLDGSKWGAKIHYSLVTDSHGTAGAVKSVSKYYHDDFLVVYGDLLINFDIHRFIDFHRQYGQDSIASIVVHTSDHPFDSDLVEVRKHHLIRIHNRPHPVNVWRHNLENAAVYILSPKIFDCIPTDRPSDFGNNIFPLLINKRLPITAYHTWEYFRDMGNPGRLKAVRREYKAGNPQQLHFQNKQKAIFFDRDGVINEEVNGVDHPDKLKIFPGIASAIKQINQSQFHAIIITNQSIIARGRATKQQVEEVHNKLETIIGSEGGVINRIYYCPHHPEYNKTKCSCRKPKLGLIKKAVQDFNIDLSQSYFIGDMVSDYLMAKNAGLKFIGVKTGYGCKPRPGKSDYPIAEKIVIKENFNQAVKYILKHSS